MHYKFLYLTLCLLCVNFNYSQKSKLPIIDMHFHAVTANLYGNEPTAMCSPLEHYPTHDPATDFAEEWYRWLQNPECENPSWSPKTDEEHEKIMLDLIEKNNMYVYASGNETILRNWQKKLPERVIPALWYSKYLSSEPSVEQVEQWFNEDKYKVFAEVAIQYDGKTPSDPYFEPYLNMCEKNDIPIGFHIGTTPPGELYISKSTNRAKLHSALVLEEALAKHPKLRVYIMHAGWPMIDDLLAVLFAHPQVYIDIGIICYMTPRKEFHNYLRRIVEAGFSKRIMFGSDYIIWPETLDIAINSIESADFLSDEQKRDIFYNNAARFLRLPQKTIDKHHGR